MRHHTPYARRAIALAAAAATAAAFLPGQDASAQQAAGQLTLIVGFGAGGSADSIARIVGNKLGDRLGQKVVVENRPGAGANLAARAVIAAPADGGTLLVTTAALPINNTLYKNKGFEIADLQAVSICATTPETLAVNKANPARNLKDFLANSQRQAGHLLRPPASAPARTSSPIGSSRPSPSSTPRTSPTRADPTPPMQPSAATSISSRLRCRVSPHRSIPAH